MNKSPSKNVPHPGSYLLQTFLTPMDLSIADAAQTLNVTPTWLEEFTQGSHRLEPNFAYQLEYTVGLTAADWLSLQLRYDLAASDTPKVEGPKFESAYWGSLIALFPFDTTMRYESGDERILQALIAVSFNRQGGLCLTIAERGQEGKSNTSFYFEHVAASAISQLKKAVDAETTIFKDDEGVKLAVARIARARKALAPSEINLTSLSKAANLLWFDCPRTREFAKVHFGYKNTPSWTTFYRTRAELDDVIGEASYRLLTNSLSKYSAY